MIQLQITLMLEEFMDRFLFKGEKKHSQNKTWKMFFIGEAMRIRGCVQTVKGKMQIPIGFLGVKIAG
jgi:hypothetical protein